MSMIARFQRWRFARENEVIAKIGAVFLADPDQRHNGYGLWVATGIPPHQLARLLERMCRRGWLTEETEQDPGERAVCRYYVLTDAGRAALLDALMIAVWAATVDVGMEEALDQVWRHGSPVEDIVGGSVEAVIAHANDVYGSA